MKPSELHVNIWRFFYDDSCITVPVQLTSDMHLLKILFKTATFRVYLGQEHFKGPKHETPGFYAIQAWIMNFIKNKVLMV